MAPTVIKPGDKNDQAIVWVSGGVMTSGFGPFSYLVIHNIQ